MTDTNKQTELHFRPTASECQGIIYADSGRAIAILYDRTDGYGELFAAAPELLAICKDGLKFLDSLPATSNTFQLENRTYRRKQLESIIDRAEKK